MNISYSLSDRLTQAVNFHPLYKRLHEKYDFSMYMRQSFLHDDFTLELMFEGDSFFSPDSSLGRFITSTTYQIGENEYEFPNLMLHMNFLGVRKEKRQQGIGIEVLSTLCQFADEEGIRYIKLDVDTQFGIEKEILQAFYKKRGFFNLSENKMLRVNPQINTTLTITSEELSIIQYVVVSYYMQLKEHDIANYPLEEIEDYLEQYQVVINFVKTLTTKLSLVDCIYLLHVTAYEDIKDERFEKVMLKLKENTILKEWIGYI